MVKVRMISSQLQIFQGKNESGKSYFTFLYSTCINLDFQKRVLVNTLMNLKMGGIMGGRIWLDETLEGSLFIERYIKMVSNVLNVKRLQEKVYPKIDGNNCFFKLMKSNMHKFLD